MLFKRLAFALIIINMVFASSLLYSQGLIIGHTAVNDFDYIPNEWLEAAKGLAMHYGSTSHNYHERSSCFNPSYAVSDLKTA